jgi:nitrogen regulatory protein PII-like uncharacterized protein
MVMCSRIVAKIGSALLSIFLFGSCSAQSIAVSPLDALRVQEPALYKLYIANQRYVKQLTEYAYIQGFRRPIENLGTVIHEMIHIDSAVHEGFFIDGIYYESGVNPAAWPKLTNKDIAPYVAASERELVYRIYVLAVPGNHLGNVVDEINAYSHVLEFICRNERDSAGPQIANLMGHLQLQDAYLRILRTMMPTEYQALSYSRESRGAIVTITKRAWKAMRACGIASKAISSQEVSRFME